MDNNELNNNVNNDLNNQVFVDDSLNNFGSSMPNNNVVNEPVVNNTKPEVESAPVSDLSSQMTQSADTSTIFDTTTTNTVVEPVAAEPKLEPITPTAMPEVKEASSEPVSSEVEEVKPKKSKGPVVFIIFLILIILGLAGYICYDKFINKDEPKTNEVTDKDDNNVVEDTSIKFVSFDSKEYLKIKSDGTYELSLDTTASYSKTGKYIQNDNAYLLNDTIKAEVKNDYIEISEIAQEGFKFYNYILFKSDKLDEVKGKIETSVSNYVNEISKDQTNSLEIEKVDVVMGTCYKYQMGNEVTKETEMGSKYVNCGLGYNIYFKDYNYDECKNSEKYINYMVAAGECKSDYVTNGWMASLDENDNYKILYTYTGM